MQRTAIAVAIALGTAGLTQGLTAESAFAGGRADSELVVYVSGQGLYYDSVLAAKRLPQKGRFQKLEMGGPHGGPMTEFGPGDHDYVGGRWWLDTNGNDEMDDGDEYFSCPLLGPGRADP